MTSHYDAIVIGSGAGGAAAAYRLVLGGLNVALVEKGDHLPTDGSTLDIRRVVHQGEFLSREVWTDGQGRRISPEEHFNVGGKTKWYGAALLRFGDHEFHADTQHGCRSWPITAREMEPYYAEAERLLGVRTFDCEPELTRILERIERSDAGWLSTAIPLALSGDIVADANEARHFDGFASTRQLKGEADRSILSLLRRRPNFTLLPRSEVYDLIGSEQSPTMAVGVRLRDGRELRARHVLLAAGALHSPRLLSRYLRTTGLDRALPAAAHVGRHLKLHLLTAMVALSTGVKADLIRKTILLTHHRFPHSSAQPLGFDGELIATLVPKWMPARVRREIGARAYGFFLQTEDGSHSHNRVIESADGISPPVLDFDARRLAPAAKEHIAFTRHFQRTLLRAGMLSFTQRIGLNGTAHACGSLICGRTPSDSVVDSQGRVHGMQGLYVVDGSILPRSSRVNPSLTIYAWGLRVGELIAQQFGGPRSTARVDLPETSHAT